MKSLRIKKALSLFTAFVMMLSLAAIVTTTASANAATAWFEFDKGPRSSGGWFVNNLERGAAKPDDSGDEVPDYGHRVEIVLHGEEAPGQAEVSLWLPEGVEYIDIGALMVTMDIDWDNWDNDDWKDIFVITQNKVNSWKEFKFLAEEVYENPVLIAEPLMQKQQGTAIIECEYFIVMVTAWEDIGVGSAKVNLLDREGNLIKLVCPQCKKTPCDCTCNVCNKKPCTCICDQCGKASADCTCCEKCGKTVEDCTCGDIVITAPPILTTSPSGGNENVPTGGDGAIGVDSGKVYTVFEGFAEWKGVGTVRARIDADKANFYGLFLNGSLVDPKNYTVTEGSTIITLKESYLRTLSAGNHNFIAAFSDYYTASIPLTVSATAASGVPKGGIAFAILPVFLAAGAVVVTSKKRK